MDMAFTFTGACCRLPQAAAILCCLLTFQMPPSFGYGLSRASERPARCRGDTLLGTANPTRSRRCRETKHVARGGALWTSTSATNEEISPFVENGMALALFSTYFAVMGAKCALPSVFSFLASRTSGLSIPDSADPQYLMARLLTVSTVAVSVGKALSGPLIDRYGGISSLQVVLSALACLMWTIAFTTRHAVFCFCWVCVDFIFATCWAACVNAVHQSFPQNQWGKRVGQLAAAARTGNAAAFFFFAHLLTLLKDDPQPWRAVFWTSAIVQIVPISLLTYFGRHVKRNNKSANQKSTKNRSLVVLRQELRKPAFWFHLASRSALMIFGSFLLFVPTVMNQIHGQTPSASSTTASIFAIGCLISVSLGSQPWSNLSLEKKISSSFVMTSVMTLSCLGQLAHVLGWLHLSPFTCTVLWFLWGASFSIPFYIPPSLYALKRGGSDSSATIVDAFDFSGFGLLAIFNGYVASISHSTRAAWIPTFGILTACSIVSLIGLPAALVYEYVEQQSSE